MKLRVFSSSFATFVALGISVSAQTLVLDEFGSGDATGGIIANTSWFGNISQDATTLTVGVGAFSDSGWQAINLSLPDLSSYGYVALTAQLAGTNAAPNIFVTFDAGGPLQTVTFLSNSFSTSFMTTVYVPITWSIDPTLVEAWNIGGGETANNGTYAFNMTFDRLALTNVPEPSTYAAIAGVFALGFVAWRRRRSVRV